MTAFEKILAGHQSLVDATWFNKVDDPAQLEKKIESFLDLLIEHVNDFGLSERGVVLDLFLKWRTHLFKEFRVAYGYDILRPKAESQDTLQPFYRLRKHVLTTSSNVLDGWAIDQFEQSSDLDSFHATLSALKERVKAVDFDKLIGSIMFFVLNNIDADLAKKIGRDKVQDFRSRVKALTDSKKTDATDTTYKSRTDYALGK